jgi:DNA-binding winged helix-turn-helix (wHTH) protein/TolB-like protein
MKESTSPYSYRFGQFELQPDERRLLAAGIQIAVEPRAFDVLVALVERAGHLVTKEELFSLVWPKRVVEENNLPVQIFALRKILGPTAIAAVPGRGYRFTLKVSSEVLGAAQPPMAAGLRHLRRWQWLAGSIAVLLFAAVGTWWSQSTSTTIRLTPPAVPSTLSVAILPFEAPTDQELAELLLPQIIDAATRNVRALWVASPRSVARYKGGEADAREIGREIKVRYVVVGNLLQQDDRRLLIARLIDTANGVQTWSEGFELPATEAPETYGAFSWRVASHVSFAVFRAEREVAAHLPLSNASATQLWLRGLDTDDGSLRGALEARKLYEKALQLDPRLTRAMLYLGMTYEKQIDLDTQADREHLRRALDELSLRALATDRTDPVAWLLRGIALNFNGRWEEMLHATSELQRIEPYFAPAFGQRAQALIELGRSAEALVEVDQGLALEPSGPSAALLWRQACKAHSYLGQYQKGIAACVKAAALQEMLSPYVYLTADYAQLGEMDKAESAKARLLKYSPGFTISRLSYSLPVNTVRDPIWGQQAETYVIPGLRKAGIPDKSPDVAEASASDTGPSRTISSAR